jgi:putative hemolysin
MSLVTSKEIANTLGISKYGFIGTFVGWLLMKILRISKVNKVYNNHKHKSDLDFLNGLLGEFQIEFEIPEEDLKRIPKTGPFITISNHPLGGIDGILLLKLLIEQRKDFKIIGNFLLHRIAPLKPYIMPVNPFEDRKEAKSSVAGIKQALLHLKEEKPLGIFPAGEVSTYRDGKLMVDKPWEEGAVRLIKKAHVPVIPIYFHAKNSNLFYVLSKISDTLRTAKLPSELLSQKKRIIKVRIGKPISVKDQDTYKDIPSFYEFLRKKTYMLANPFEKKTPKILSAKNLKIPKPPKKIISQKNVNLFIKEIVHLREKGDRLLESKNYEVFFANAKDIPNLLQEIGRLREITFRDIGEGTNKAIDLDKFDKYYYHLILWDREANVLAGAYRMGLGKDIYKKHGIAGFYIHTLFRFEPELYSMMENTIEMGRAFIIKEYQQRPMPLFLLWKGIVYVTLRYPEYKYLMGGVSISNKFSEFSKSLMIEFMRSHYYDPYIAQYIFPKKEFKVQLKDADKDFVFDATKSDMQKLDKIIDEIEPGILRIPVLIKKYVKQNARLIAFNVDPKFNDAVDGLMYIRVADIPESTVKPVMEEFQAELERRATEMAATQEIEK